MRISIIAHPNSKRPRAEVDLTGALHVYVTAPPLEGKANREVINSLASHFHTKSSHITLLSGQKSKVKVFEID